MLGTELPALGHVAEGRLASGPATESTSDQDSSKLLSLSRDESCDWHLASWARLQLGELESPEPSGCHSPRHLCDEPLLVVTSGSSPPAESRDTEWDIPT